MNFIEGHRAIHPPAGVVQWDVDPYEPEVLQDLEGYYDQLRARGPFVYLTRYAMLACGQYESTREVFSDWERFVSSRGVGLTDFSLAEPWRPPSLVLEVDPPYHSKTRRVIARALSQRAIADLKAGFKQEAEALIDTLVLRASFDAVSELAEVYPLTVFPAAVGLRNVDRERLLEYGNITFNALGPDNALRRQVFARAPSVVPWISAQCTRRELHPLGLGATIFQAVDEGELSEHEGEMLVRSLLSAGLDTTITSLGSLMWCLAQFPDVLDEVRANPGSCKAIFDETLRLTSPVHSFCRTSKEDTQVCDVPIPRDAKILCVLGAANLDPDQWPNPGHFDSSRRGHLAFGVGIHSCVGQAIAKAEAEAILSALASRVRKIELLGSPEWRSGHAIHSLKTLPIRFVS